MDNNALRVVGGWERDGSDDLLPVLQIALNHENRCVAWAVKDGSLYLYWTQAPGTTPLLADLKTAEDLHSLVVSWLEANPPADEINGGDADEEPNGFEAWTNEWGHGGGEHSAMLAIKPRTRWIGK